ncbi:translin-associated protein X-like [Halichondria panicea]|uniref:translin-associated protein X-like n=1 Tax=Halichondria panicea TaxID=6063 RepID=UPI00312B4750
MCQCEEDKIPSSPYKEIFLEFQHELDFKYDKHERLVKLSRDCTIQSKRVIFALHRISGNEALKGRILSEARKKISSEILCLLQGIILENEKKDPRKHHTAFSPGLQEFIEAIAFLTFLSKRRLVTMEEVQSYLTFKVQQESFLCEPTGAQLGSEEAILCLPLDPVDYVLGIADLTGELMRLCINAVGCGDRELPFNMLTFMRATYSGFLSLRSIGKEMGRKTSVLKSSLMKVERVCYTLKIRGSEIPEHLLVRAIATDTDNNVDDYSL